MKRMLDSIKWEEDFDFDDLRFWGVFPIKVLIEEAVQADDQEKRSILCEILNEKICELDESFERIDSEHREYLRTKKHAA